MGKYHFDFEDNGRLSQDKDGHELDGLQAARVEAITILPELIKGLTGDGDQHTFSVTVRNEIGTPVFRVTLSLDCEWLN